MSLETLVVKYPKIFKDRYAPITQTAMCWGFECGEGWFNLLDQCCYLIQQHIDNTRQSRLLAIRYNRALKKAIEGDEDALYRYYSKGSYKTAWMEDQVTRDLDRQAFRPVPPVCVQVVAIQVKEKWGGLRFYYNGGDNYIHGVVSMAEAMSYVTCETCGDKATLHSAGWHYVACEPHTRSEDKIES